MSNLDKLCAFDTENLFSIESYLIDEKIFENWINELKQQIQEIYPDITIEEGDNFLLYTFLSPRNCSIEKYETFYFSDIMHVLESPIVDFFDDNPDITFNGENIDCPIPIPIIWATFYPKNSETQYFKIAKTPKEIIDVLYKYAVKHKVSGYKFDW